MRKASAVPSATPHNVIYANHRSLVSIYLVVPSSLSLLQTVRWLHSLCGWCTFGAVAGSTMTWEGERMFRREKKGQRDWRLERKREYDQEGKERISALTSPHECFFLLFFPRRVITSLSARQLRRKKSSNNHIYGAAASLRCIDPRRWPGRVEKRKESQPVGRVKREEKGRIEARRSWTKRAPMFCWNRSAARRAEVGIFLADVQEPFQQNRTYNCLSNAKVDAVCTLTIKIKFHTSRLDLISFNRNID